MTDMDALKPCPFCGGEACLGTAPQYAFVNCMDCLASTNLLTAESHRITYAEARAAWNTRAALKARNTRTQEGR